MAALVAVDASLFAVALMTDPFQLYLLAEAGLLTLGLKLKKLVLEDVVPGQQT